MPYGGMIPGTNASPGVGGRALKSYWDSVFRLKPTEEMAIANDFAPPEGVEKVGDQLLIRILPKLEAKTLAGPTALELDISTILRVTQTPTFKYVAVSLPDTLRDRLDGADVAQLTAKY